jgi:hypothetical protein
MSPGARPYTCTFGQNTTSCGPGYKPDLNILLRDLDLDVYKQNYRPGPESSAWPRT